jgi:hypothetical protein
MEIVDAPPRVPAGDHANVTQALIGVLILAGFFAAFAASLLIEPPPAARSAVDILLGYLGAMSSGVVSFYFGSSSGSASKNRLLAERPK